MASSNFQSKARVASNPKKQTEAKQRKKSSEESPKCKQFAGKEQCEAWGREARALA